MNEANFLTLRDSIIKTFDNPLNLSLCIVHGLSNRDENEMRSRGWLGYAYLFDSNNENYWPLNFYDTVRLTQDLEIADYIDDVGIIIVKEVTLMTIIDTCCSILKNDYIKYQK